MNHLKRMLSIVIAMSLLLVACSGPSSEERAAKRLMTEYKKAMMEVKDYREIDMQDGSFVREQENKVRDYFTEEGSKVFVNREFIIYQAYAAKHKRNVELGEVQLTSMKEESDAYDYSYRIPVRIKDETGEVLEEHEYQGQIKLAKENGRLLIDKEWSRPINAMAW